MTTLVGEEFPGSRPAGRISLPMMAGQTIDLIGLGTDVTALLPALVEVAGVVRAWVDDPDSASAQEKAAAETCGVSIAAIAEWREGARYAIRAPGFPRYRSDVAAIRTQVRTTTPVDLWLNTFGSDHPTTIVTGTKGKSTVCTMLHALLPNSLLAGNIGVPIWSLPARTPGQPIICEVSSYQAADTAAVVDLALLTSLSEDHVSWHGSVEQYRTDKLRPVLNAQRALASATLAEWFIGYRGEMRTVETADIGIAVGDLAMPVHMARNGLLALAAARWLDLEFDSVETVANPVKVLNDLPPLPGRLRRIESDIDEHRWYDDALASNPSGSAAAVLAFLGHPIFLIVGGIDREVSLEPLISAVSAALASGSTVHICTLPDNGPAIAEQLSSECGNALQVFDAEDLSEAVELARIYADQTTVVLFSPAAPTPGRFGNWKNRSDQFETAVHSAGAFAD